MNTAKKAIEYYQMIPIRLVDVDLNISVEISHLYKINAYDAYFLECARNYSSPLLTLDNGLTKVAKQMNINVIEV